MTHSKSDDEHGALFVISKVMDEPNATRQPPSDAFPADELSIGKEEDHEEDQPVINNFTKKESNGVLQLKLMVLFILVVSAATIASVFFLYITRGETSQFKAKFRNDVAKLLYGVGSSLHRTLGLLDSLAVAYISHATYQNDTWPFVTLPHFGARLAKILPLTDAIIITVAPIDYPEKRKAWEEYSLQNDE
jgi:hypothetical protein